MLRRPLAAFACSFFLLACGGGRPSSAPQCQHDRDCLAGQGCVANACTPLPCAGACQPEQACGSDGKCTSAQGATCADHTCPAGYRCNGTVCAKGCTLNSDCEPGFVCNSQLHSCAQCTFNADCAAVTGKTSCDSTSGVCVACQANIDCVTTVGPGHICANHACVGCQTDADCNAGTGEKCDGATQGAPGRCIQCKTRNDCSVGAPACDDTGHCVGCFGSTPTEANGFCGPGSPECDLPNKTCVACLTANNASGLDCGYQGTTPPDPHSAKTCNPATHSCVPGCATDAQCGCPRNALGGVENGDCGRFANQEHCDPAKPTINGASSLGACVQCRPRTNTDCAYKVKGSTQHAGAYATLNGSRCVSDTCVEGCDDNTDCPGNRICHLGASGDLNNHKCVECACDVPGTDPSYCEIKTDGTPACAADSHGNDKVCDAATLSCRHRRQNETCNTSGQCGDTTDPGTLCDPLVANPPGSNTFTGFCVFSSRPEPNDTGTTYCSSAHALGKCGVPCDDFQLNECTAAIHCPSGSSCRAATSETMSHSICVSQACY